MPHRAEPLPEATLLPSARSAQVTANSKRTNSRQGAGHGEERREGGGRGREARGSSRRPLKQTRGIEKGKRPWRCPRMLNYEDRKQRRTGLGRPQ